MYRLIVLLFIPMLLAQSPGNHPPIIQNIDTSVVPFYPNSYDLDVTAHDGRLERLTYDCTSDSRALTITANGSNQIRIDVQPGTTKAVITVSVTDLHGGKATQTWDFLGSNQPPNINKFFTTAYLAQNKRNEILSADISDADGDPLSASFRQPGTPTDLVQIGQVQNSGQEIQSRLAYHAYKRGMIELEVEVDDRNGGIATGTLRVQVGKLLRRVGFWSTNPHVASPSNMDLDRDGNLMVVSLGVQPNFIKFDTYGNLVSTGTINSSTYIDGLAIQHHLPDQPLYIGNTLGPTYLASFSNDGSVFGGDLGFQTPISSLTQQLDSSTLIGYIGTGIAGISRLDTNGVISDVVLPGRLGVPRQIANNPQTDDFFVADQSRNNVFAFEADGTFIREYPSSDMPYSQPFGLWCDAREEILYIADTSNNRILVLNLETGERHQTLQDNMWFTPRTMIQLPNGHIAVSNFSRGGVEVFALK